jgi:Rod binding domain-containing protein
MNISPVTTQITPNAANVPIEELAANQHLSEKQKIAEASRQFESMMLRQILSESQKPVITSEFTDNSTAAGIYQDYITNTLADSMSKAGTLGLAKVFEQQLSHPSAKTGTDARAVINHVPWKPAVPVDVEPVVHQKTTPLFQHHHE